MPAAAPTRTHNTQSDKLRVMFDGKKAYLNYRRVKNNYFIELYAANFLNVTPQNLGRVPEKHCVLTQKSLHSVWASAYCLSMYENTLII
jgi:hypothetical protein